MYKIKVFTIGKCKEAWLHVALQEYEKRLSHQMEIEWRLAKSEKELEEWLVKESYIALDPKGMNMNSNEWALKMESFGLRQQFVIGGATGLSESIFKGAQFIWSLSPLTFTHQITRLILIEQLYRALEIQKGTNYHK